MKCLRPACDGTRPCASFILIKMHVLGTRLIIVMPIHVLRHRPLRFLQRVAVDEGARKTLHSAIKLFFLQEQAISLTLEFLPNPS